MVSGALKISNADVGVTITGIAGPTGATETNRLERSVFH